MVSGKKFPEVFSTLSENKEDVAAFPVTRRIMVLSVGEPPTAGFSIEMSDLSDISSRSSVPVEVEKSRPSSTGVDLLVNLLFPFPSVPDPARISSALPTFPFRLRIAFDSLFQPFCLKIFYLLVPIFLGSFNKKDHSLISFVSSISTSMS